MTLLLTAVLIPLARFAWTRYEGRERAVAPLSVEDLMGGVIDELRHALGAVDVSVVRFSQQIPAARMREFIPTTTYSHAAVSEQEQHGAFFPIPEEIPLDLTPPKVFLDLGTSGRAWIKPEITNHITRSIMEFNRETLRLHVSLQHVSGSLIGLVSVSFIDEREPNETDWTMLEDAARHLQRILPWCN